MYKTLIKQKVVDQVLQIKLADNSVAEVKEKGINNDKHLAKDKVICQIFFFTPCWNRNTESCKSNVVKFLKQENTQKGYRNTCALPMVSKVVF